MIGSVVEFRLGFGRMKNVFRIFEEFHIFTLTNGAIKCKYMRDFNFFQEISFYRLTKRPFKCIYTKDLCKGSKKMSKG